MRLRLEAGRGGTRVATRRITIFDTTLRDGEQSPGIALQPRREGGDRRAARAARRRRDRGGLRDLFARRLRGRPGRRRQSVEHATVASLARTELDDVDAAVEALAGATPLPAPRRSSRRARSTWSGSSTSSRPRCSSRRVTAVAHAAGPRRRGRVLGRGRDPLGPGVPREVCRAAIAAGATTVNLPDTVGYCPARTSTPRSSAEVQAPLPRARPASPSPSTATTTSGSRVANTLAGVAAGRRTGRVHRQRDRRAGGQRRARGGRDGAARPRRRARAPRPASTSARSAASSALVSRLTGYAVQRNKAIVGANAFAHEAGHPPGRDAEGRRDLPDHGSRGAGADDDAPARQAFRPPRVRPRVRRRRHRAGRRRAPGGLRAVQAAGRRAQGRDPVRRLRGGAGPHEKQSVTPLPV